MSNKLNQYELSAYPIVSNQPNQDPGIYPSDFRFKNILKKLFTTKDGVNVYSYIYKHFMNIEGIFTGVIAQELIGTKHEDALVKVGDYYYVNYYKVPDVDFKRID